MGSKNGKPIPGSIYHNRKVSASEMVDFVELCTNFDGCLRGFFVARLTTDGFESAVRFVLATVFRFRFENSCLEV